MGLFTRRRPLTDEQDAWQPDGYGMITSEARSMDDERIAADGAYGARFTLGSAPAASINIWCYAIFGPDDVSGSYVIGMRCEYWLHSDHPGAPPQCWVQYDDDAEWYFSATAADDSARDFAGTLATTPRIGPSCDDLGFFDWDGVPS
jgi:hypothetical protein